MRGFMRKFPCTVGLGGMRTGAMQTKLRMKPHSMAMMVAIDSYIRQYDISGDHLSHAASDELDGAVFRREVDDLVRRRLLCIVHFRDGYGQPDMCGSRWTVALTDKAMAALWPDRMTPNYK